MIKKLDDQFEDYLSNKSEGFLNIQLRKTEAEGNYYQYKIGDKAKLMFNDETGNRKNYADKIIPKPPGEWIDIQQELQDEPLYLYLECQVSPPSTNQDRWMHKFLSGELKVVKILPENFLGDFFIEGSEYRTTLCRKLLAKFVKEGPILLTTNDYIFMDHLMMLGFYKYTLI